MFRFSWAGYEGNRVTTKSSIQSGPRCLFQSALLIEKQLYKYSIIYKLLCFAYPEAFLITGTKS